MLMPESSEDQVVSKKYTKKNWRRAKGPKNYSKRPQKNHNYRIKGDFWTPYICKKNCIFCKVGT